MKKITLLLLALICAVGVRAITIETGKAYAIKNVALDAFLSITTTVEGEVSLQAMPEAVYFQTGSIEGTYKISTAATSGTQVGASQWYAKPVTEGADWTIEDVSEGVRLKASTGYLAPDATSAPASLWSDKAKEHEKGVYVIIDYNEVSPASVAKNNLNKAISTATNITDFGTGFAQYTQTDVTAAINTATDSYNSTTKTTQSDYEDAISVLQKALEASRAKQIATGTWILKSSYDTYIGLDGENLIASTTSDITAAKVTFEKSSTSGQYYMLVNGKYVKDATQSAQVVVTSDKNDAKTYTIDKNAESKCMFNYNGSRYSSLHCSGSKTIVGWEDANATRWTVEEAPTTYDVTYDFKLNGTTVCSNTIPVAPDAAYPTPTLPSSVHTSADYYTLGETPSGTVTSNVTKDITITQQNLPFEVSASYAEAKWYTMTLTDGKQYLYYADGQTQMNLDRTTTTCEGKDLFCFVGNIVTGFTIYNKLAGSDKVLSSSNNPWDGKTGGITYVTLQEKGAANTIQAWDLTKGNEIGGKTGFYLGMHGLSSEIRMNARNENSSSSNYVAFWNGGAGTGSTFLVEDAEQLINDKFEALASASTFDILEGSTVQGPSEFAAPEEINAAIEAAQSVDDNVTAKAAFIASENGQKIQKYLDEVAKNGTLANIQFTMNNEYGTLCLPCPATAISGLKMYTCSALEANGTTLNLSENSGNFEHNTPYIIQATKGNKYTIIGWDKGSTATHKAGYLTGVLTEDGVTITDANSYVLATRNSDGVQAFFKTDADGENGTVKCPQYKCYLTVPAGGGVKALYFDNNGEETAINDLQFDNVQGTIGNGKFLENGTIVIVKNGKKYNVAGQRVKN